MFIALAILTAMLSADAPAGDGQTYEIRERGKETLYGFVEEMNDGMVQITPETPWAPVKPYYRKKSAVEYDAESAYHRQQRIEDGYAAAGYVRVKDVYGEERWIARAERDFADRAKALAAAKAAALDAGEAAAQPSAVAVPAPDDPAEAKPAGLRPFVGHIVIVALAIVAVAAITKKMILAG